MSEKIFFASAGNAPRFFAAMNEIFKEHAF